jgi:hypothetical protein
LLAVRAVVGRRPTVEDQLRELRMAPLVSDTIRNGIPGPGHARVDPLTQGLYDFIARCAGDTVREQVKNVVHDFLAELNAAISRRIDKGDRHPSIIATADFARTETVWLGQRRFTAGIVDSLPAGHALRDVPTEYALPPNKERALVLGAVASTLRPRAFYGIANAKEWTALIAKVQLTELDGKRARDLTDAEFARLRRAGIYDPKPLKAVTGTDTPPAVAVPEDWRERLLTALATLPRVETAWRPPPDEATLADCLEIRNLFFKDDNGFDLEDTFAPPPIIDATEVKRGQQPGQQFAPKEESEPYWRAAAAFAGRYAGYDRRMILTEQLHRMCKRIDVRITEAEQDGLQAGTLLAAAGKAHGLSMNQLAAALALVAKGMESKK